MKRFFSIILALFLIVPFMGHLAPSANALGEVWVKNYYKDKFGDPTEEYYLINKKAFVGAFNSKNVKNGKLYADLIIDLDKVSIVLYENKTDLVFNKENSPIEYTVFIKDSKGEQIELPASMPADADRVYFKDGKSLTDALCSGNGEIGVFIECKKTSTDYQFKLKCGNFEKIFQEEIQTPINEKKYQRALELLEGKQFDASKELFIELGDFKDSTKKVLEVEEAKKAETYAQAEEFLGQGQFDAAKELFINLGEYKDSKIRLEEVEDAKKKEEIARQEKEKERLALKVFDLNGFKSTTGELFSALEALLSDETSEFYVGENVSFTRDSLYPEILNIDYNPGLIQICPMVSFTSDDEPILPEKDGDMFTSILLNAVDQYEGFNMEEAVKKVASAMIFLTKESVTNYAIAASFLSQLEEMKGSLVGDGPLAFQYNFEKLQSGPMVYTLTVEDRVAAAYNNAEGLLKANLYQEAIDAFWALGDYKDSKERVEEAIEEKNASIYAQAEKALRQKEYNYAAELFKYLGQYKDSAERALEVEEAEKADAYSKAEKLLQGKDYDKAIDAFQELGDYKDSNARAISIIEEKNEEYYSRAMDLMQKREYLEAYDLLIKIQGFKDVDSLLTTNKDFLAIYQERDELERQLRKVGSIIKFGKYEQNNDTDDGDEPVEWIVISVEDNRSLIISQNILATRPYNNSKGGSILGSGVNNEGYGYAVIETIDWKECNIRSWLNDTFYKSAFDEEEKKLILVANTVEELKRKDVPDYVFLLSADEAKQYGVMETCYTTEYARSHGSDDRCSWWLRRDSLTSVGESVSKYGGIETNPIDSRNVGVRPAVWIDIGSEYFLKIGAYGATGGA